MKPPIISGFAVGYVRVSLEEQARRGLSLPDQEAKIRGYAQLFGLVLHEVIHDAGVSATKPLRSRPGGRQLLDLLEAGGTEVIAIKLDRLFRNAADCLSTVETWDRTGKHLHLVDFGGQAINTASAAGRLFITMLAGFAAFERDLIAERTASALAFRKSAGQAYSRDPYGFKRDGSRLVQVQSEQDTLRRIKTLRANGTSLREIARQLNEEGIRPKRGRAWYASSIRSILR